MPGVRRQAGALPAVERQVCITWIKRAEGRTTDREGATRPNARQGRWRVIARYVQLAASRQRDRLTGAREACASTADSAPMTGKRRAQAARGRRGQGYVGAIGAA